MAITDSISGMLPSSGSIISIGTTTFRWLTIFIIFVVFLIIGGIGVYFIFRWLRFNKKIIIFEKINNKWEQTGRDRASEIKFGIMGDAVFFLRRRKKYLPLPTLQMGRRVYWFGVREDGEWTNIGIEDIDLKLKKANIKYVFPEMKYARTSLSKLMKDRYDKPKFMDKYGHIIVPVIALAIICLLMYFLVDKIISVGDKANAMVTTADKVLDKADRILGSLDNICVGSGIRKT